ncbi:hypothetical protein [Ensifer sp. 4252]
MAIKTTHRMILAVTAIAAILAAWQVSAEPVQISPAWAASMP